MSKAKLMAALENFYSGYCVRVDAEKLLDTKVEIGGKTSTVAKIARKENFTADLLMWMKPLRLSKITNTACSLTLTMTTHWANRCFGNLGTKKNHFRRTLPKFA